MSDDDFLDDALLALAGDEDEAEEGEASDAASPANSLGSGAMDESDSSRDSPDATDTAVMFPLEGVFRNERDKADIMALPQVKREEILADREEQKQQKNFSAQLARRAKQIEHNTQGLDDKRKRKASSAELDENQRKASRPKVKSSQHLEAYKRQREQRGQLRERQNDRRNHGRRESSGSNRASDIDAEGESEVEWDSGAKAAQATREEVPPNLNHYDMARVGRGLFHVVCFYPGFEETMIGAFCRVGSGQDPATGRTLYKMAQIKGFTTGKPYGFEGKGEIKAWTDLYVVVQHGIGKKEWQFQYLSNQKFTESELETYKKHLAENNLKAPTRTFLEQKVHSIKALVDHHWNEEEVNAMIARKQKFMHLEQASIKVAPPSQSELAAQRIADLNKANRIANSESIRKALIAERRQREREQRERALKRQKEREAKEEAEKAKLLQPPKSNLDDLFEASDRSRSGTPATLAKPSGTSTPAKKERKGIPTFKKRTMDDDIIASLDIGIEIDI
ncbi:uncharacterized protein BDZ99DRAFT_496889 [Mytilinidion resinicola]|uniref:Plus3 domain-containing protein n=1 Tax=Mytilinidion resinicola TaxID=574789 RepID=A0A6A6YUM7_9PEZI|nr:uncharacterized protein BDZ99DRAFT_496889 [Mytilinidion resinicola]KAF2812481.1 hypothetical protein BDZ99DRAFT_496889 [Mytilinidion resinicola]